MTRSVILAVAAVLFLACAPAAAMSAPLNEIAENNAAEPQPAGLSHAAPAQMALALAFETMLAQLALKPEQRAPVGTSVPPQVSAP